MNQTISELIHNFVQRLNLDSQNKRNLTKKDMRNDFVFFLLKEDIYMYT